MNFAEPVRSYTRTHPRQVTGVLSIFGYALVIRAFAGLVPVPELETATVQLLPDLIAVINTMALFLLVVGWRFIKRGDVPNHRAAMLSSFALIMLLLVLPVWKVGSGLEKASVGPTVVQYLYWALLVVHILLSVVLVLIVLHAVLGLTYNDSRTQGDSASARRPSRRCYTDTQPVPRHHPLRHAKPHYGWEPIRRIVPFFLLSTRGIPALQRTDR